VKQGNIIEVSGLKKHFPIRSGFLKRVTGHVKAVDGVSLEIGAQDSFGLVGESGCGKTTLGRCLLRAVEPTAGDIMFRLSDGRELNITTASRMELVETRREMQIIFQDPYSSLNPRMTVQQIIAEPLICNRLMSGKALKDRVKELTELVGLSTRHLERYPHAFSGGQRQRIGIARSLATWPRFLVCDEAVSALDVSIQAQVLNLLMELQEKLKFSFMFISHDLGVIRHISSRVGVMYVGKLVEVASTAELFAAPLHPYTQALLSARPTMDPTNKTRRILLEGEVANPANPPSGCYFHPRCRFATARCAEAAPSWHEVKPRHFTLCDRLEEIG